MRRTTPKLKAPEQRNGCPECEYSSNTMESEHVTRFDDGGVVGDLVCPECGHTVKKGATLNEPAPTTRETMDEPTRGDFR